MSRASLPITLTIPGRIPYRDLAVRTVAGACQLVGAEEHRMEPPTESLDLTKPFDAELVSAVSEIFNNIVMHGYGAGREGDVEIAMAPSNDRITVRITDVGESFDPGEVPTPELTTMPENGMGLHIVRSFVDELEYEAGPPNVWHLVKFADRSGQPFSEPAKV